MPFSNVLRITFSHGGRYIGERAPRLSPSQTDRYSIYLPWREGRLSWPWCWLPLWLIVLLLWWL